MADKEYRILKVEGGAVDCLPSVREPVEKCRFCVFSRYFKIKGTDYPSPALAFCVLHRQDSREIDLKQVDAVTCADRKGEGFRSMLNVIG